MRSPKPTLDDLRREIDEIDAAVHDLILRRTEVVERIAELKPAGRAYIRPAREAAILRTLTARHRGRFPVGALARIWREMIAALTRIQGPFAVAVYAPEDNRAFWDIARDHYGSCTPMTALNSPLGVLRAVADGTATVGVLPYPEDEDPEPWWRYLFSDDAKSPRIVARLPFVPRPHARNDEPDLLAFAAVPLEPTGHDRTLLGLELAEDVSRGRLKDHLEASGLPPTQMRTQSIGEGRGGAAHLVEVDGFVAADDARLRTLAERLGEGLGRLLPVGAYAIPLGHADLPVDPRPR